MSQTLRQLATEQAERARGISVRLENHTASLPAVAKILNERLVKKLRSIAAAMTDLAKSSHGPPKDWEEFKDLSYGLRNLEWASVVAVERFSERDAALDKLVQRIASETRAVAPVLTVGWSTSYYHLDSEGVLYVPFGEQWNLLSWPDIYHELGHRTMDETPDVFHEAVVRELRDRFGQQMMQATNLTETDRIDGLRKNWTGRPVPRRKGVREGWYIEFVADMLAAFMCGPAYAASHVRLSWVLNKDPFSFDASHPADAARFKAILVMLESLGLNADEAKAEWDEFVQVTKSPNPPDYEVSHPDELFEAIRDVVLKACHGRGLVSFKGSGLDDVSRSVDEAWRQFRADATAFTAWNEQRSRTLIAPKAAP